MRLARISATLVLLASPALVTVRAQSAQWGKAGMPRRAYEIISTAGVATDNVGATIALRSVSTAATSGFGTITGVLPADTFRMRRVRLSADIDTKNVTTGASPWLRLDGPTSGTMLFLDNAQDRAVRGTSTGHIDITLFVPSATSTLVFGLLLNGTGEATARNLRLEALPRVVA